MISPVFYNRKNLAQKYLGGKVLHYPIKGKSITMESYQHTILQGESMYSLASQIFGENREYQWTLIADNNIIRRPDEWQVGDIVNLPRIILRDSDTILNR